MWQLSSPGQTFSHFPTVRKTSTGNFWLSHFFNTQTVCLPSLSRIAWSTAKFIFLDDIPVESGKSCSMNQMLIPRWLIEDTNTKNDIIIHENNRGTLKFHKSFIYKSSVLLFSIIPAANPPFKVIKACWCCCFCLWSALIMMTLQNISQLADFFLANYFAIIACVWKHQFRKLKDTFPNCISVCF